MSKFRSIKNSFLGGQISPTAIGRTDLPQYPHSCVLMQNMIPMTSGGAYRRPGTLNMTNLPVTNNTAPRLFPFIQSRAEPYCILLSQAQGGSAFAESFRATGNLTGNYIQSTITGTPPYKIGQSGLGGTTFLDDEINDIQYCQIADVLYLSHPAHKPQLVKRTGLDTFTIGDFDSGLGGQNLVSSRPYLNQSTTGVTLQPSATTGNINLTASTGIFTSAAVDVGSIYVIQQTSGHIGACIVTGYTSATVVTATVLLAFNTSVTAYATWWESAWSNKRGWPKSCCVFLQRLVFAGTTFQPDSIWFSEGAGYATFSLLGTTIPYVSGGVGPYQGVDDSSVTDVGGGTLTPGASPFRITLSQNTLDQIQWLSPDKELLIGTVSQEWIVSPGSDGNFQVGDSPTTLQSKYGSDNVSAVRIGYELIFPMVTQDEVRAYQYNYIDASFFAEPVQLFFDQYPQAEPGTTFQPGRRKLKYMDWDVTRQTLWCIDTAGNFYGMTRDRKLSVTMWHTHQLGGYNPAQGQKQITTGGLVTSDSAYQLCDGSVTSFAIVPNTLSGINDIWMIVKRTANGDTNWQLERMIGKNTVNNTAYSAVNPGTSYTEPYTLDACVSGADFGDPTDFAMPADVTHLNGYAQLTGAYYSATNGIFKLLSGVVAGGAALLQQPLPVDFGTVTNVFVMGLPYLPIIQPVRVEAGSVIGTAQGAIGKVQKAFIRVFKSMALMVGCVGPEQNSPPTRVNFRSNAVPMGKSAEIFTGIKNVLIPSAYDRDGILSISQPDPLPFTLVCVIMEGVEFD